MHPTLEARPDLELNAAVRAFSPTGDLTYARLDAPSLDRVAEAVATGAPRAVVIDLLGAASVSNAALGDLLELRRRLVDSHVMLFLLAENPILREFLAGIDFRRYFVIVGSRDELTERLQLATNPPDDVTEDDLAAARAANVSIEDILREVGL